MTPSQTHQPLEPVRYRFWWVKSRDAFHGYHPHKGDNVRNDRAPAEAVLTDSIAPNTESTRGYNHLSATHLARDRIRKCLAEPPKIPHP
jgi:hypothetical protein